MALRNPTNSEAKLKIHDEHLNYRDSFNWLDGNCNFQTTEGLFVDEFCLNIFEDGHYTAEVCEKITGSDYYR